MVERENWERFCFWPAFWRLSEYPRLGWRRIAVGGRIVVRTGDGGSGVKEQLPSAFRPIKPDGFDLGGREITLSLQEAVTPVLRCNRGIRVASYKPEQARAGIMEAKAA